MSQSFSRSYLQQLSESKKQEIADQIIKNKETLKLIEEIAILGRTKYTYAIYMNEVYLKYKSILSKDFLIQQFQEFFKDCSVTWNEVPYNRAGFTEAQLKAQNPSFEIPKVPIITIDWS